MRRSAAHAAVFSPYPLQRACEVSRSPSTAFGVDVPAPDGSDADPTPFTVPLARLSLFNSSRDDPLSSGGEHPTGRWVPTLPLTFTLLCERPFRLRARSDADCRSVTTFGRWRRSIDDDSRSATARDGRG